MFDKIKLYAKIAWDYISRHAVYVLLILTTLIFMKPGEAEIKTFFFICGAAGLAILLAMMAVYAYTRFDFVNFRFRGVKDAEKRRLSHYEKAASILTLGLIFIGICLLVAVCVFGYYWTVFAPVPTPNGL